MMEDKTRVFTFAGRVLKNLFQKPATVQYPFQPAEYPERMRGHVEIKIEDCICCGLCVRSCPSQAISVDRKAGTWTIGRFDCVQCGSCVLACPKKWKNASTAPSVRKNVRRRRSGLTERKKHGRWMKRNACSAGSAHPHVRSMRSACRVYRKPAQQEKTEKTREPKSSSITARGISYDDQTYAPV